MKMRLAPSIAAHGAWLTAGRSAAGAVLVAIAVSACTGGSSSSVPSIFTPTPQTSGQGSSATHSGTRTPSPPGQTSRSSGGASASRGTTPTHSGSASAAASPRDSGTSHAAASTPKPTQTAATGTPTPHASATVSPSPAYPTAAPETGGGGTAGLQDGLLFGAGGAAVFAGLGTLAYRRRLRRKFDTDEQAGRTSAPRDPANR